MRIAVTGVAGFIGYHLARRLLADGHQILGYDGVTPYYDVGLKRARLARLLAASDFGFVEAMLEDRGRLAAEFSAFKPKIIIHLAAQAGVRYSIEHPEAYLSSNLDGLFAVLEAARMARPEHLLLASSSSIYGANASLPFRETDRTDFPVSLYAATKKAGEAMAHSHSQLWGVPTTCFRFFTVYGPWGRPDMALFKFTAAMLGGQPIDIYGRGRMRRDFTYVDDLIEAIVRLVPVRPEVGKPENAGDSLSPVAAWRTVNIAGGAPVGLLEFVEAIEAATGRTAQKVMLPMQPGDVAETWADASLLQALTGYLPATPVAVGVEAFVAWYRQWIAEQGSNG
ncbi:MAG: UDP-glucuronate 5-epimerase [Devosia sp.]|nr:UDP-glucuronate 5-epimerase [Devosia sp.]